MSLFEYRFYGERLRDALDARGMRASELAELVDVTAASISNYEHNKQTPRPDVAARICDKLNLPMHFFTAPATPTPHLHWRSMAAAKKVARKRAAQRFKWLCEVLHVIESRVECPASNMLNINPPKDPTELSDSDVEEAAQQLRKHWKLGDGPISHTVRLAENNGVVVVRAEIGDYLDAFSNWSTLDRTRYCVVLGTDKKSAVRSRFNMMHELAHGVLHRNVSEETARTKDFHDAMEDQADRFAAAFLMPVATFPAEVYSVSLDSLVPLKPRWLVAIQAMIMRMSHLRMINDAEKQRLFAQVSQRHWRKSEPLDDEIEIEQPQLLRRAIDIILNKNLIDPKELVGLVRLHIPDIERAIGVAAGYITNEATEPLNFPFLKMA